MKFLNLWQGAAFASLVALGAAQAQTSVGAGSYNISPTSATVSQTITVTVPKRFGLHLHNNAWTLDLSTISSSAGPCYRAGNHSSGLGSAFTGRDFLYGTGTTNDAKILSLIAAATYRGDQAVDPANPYSYLGSLNWNNPAIDSQPTGGYPGFYVNSGKLEWKGPIMCSFQTIVQKFANTNGWRFTSSLADNNATAAAPARPWTLPLYVADRFTGGAIAGFNSATGGLRLLPGSTNTRTLASAAPTGGTAAPRTTGGWLDDNILQVLLFDGTETNGTYSGTVTYTLGDFANASQAFCPPAAYTDANNQTAFGTGTLTLISGVQRCILNFEGPNGPDTLNYTPAYN